jgi:CsoR family transcriptional regulator, copper-sensing transcriptional repressor
MEQLTTHQEQLEFLRKIEGQVRGVQKMIQDKRYCVDIITQIHSVLGALSRVERQILKKHIEGCVVHAFSGTSRNEKETKIKEVMEVLEKFRSTA